nr:MAG TPA: hypothetical protein [Caudoviricetes sp.]
MHLFLQVRTTVTPLTVLLPVVYHRARRKSMEVFAAG